MSKSNKSTRKIVAITVKEGDIIEATVAKVKHPTPGVLLVIEGNPMAFMPNSTLIGKTPADKQARRDALTATPGEKVRVQVIETKDAGHDPANPEKQRLIVNEIKPFLAQRDAESKDRKAQAQERAAAKVASTRAAVEALVVDMVYDGVVVQIAEKDSTRNPGEKFTFGAYVDIGGVSGLLHNRAMDGAVKVGDKVRVVVESAQMDGDKPRIALNAIKAADHDKSRELLSLLNPGQKTNGRDVRAANVDNVEGFTMSIGEVGIPAFLPAADAHVKDTSVLTKGSRTARVIVTGQIIGGQYALVTREGV